MSTDIIKAESAALEVSAPTQQPTMLQVVMAAAGDPNTDADKLEKLLNIGLILEDEKRKQEFNRAFHAAYSELTDIKILKNGEIVYPGKNGKPDSVVKFPKHSDLAKIIKPVLVKHGLTASYTAEIIPSPAKTVMVMDLNHVNGYSKQFRSVPLPMVDSGGGKNDVQGAGSVSTYGRRYAIIPAFDIVCEDADDDGNLGKATPPITQEQADKIDDILTALNDKEPGKRTAFIKWIGAQFKVEKISELRQGDQLAEVMAKLDAAQRQAGIKR